MDAAARATGDVVGHRAVAQLQRATGAYAAAALCDVVEHRRAEQGQSGTNSGKDTAARRHGRTETDLQAVQRYIAPGALILKTRLSPSAVDANSLIAAVDGHVRRYGELALLELDESDRRRCQRM